MKTFLLSDDRMVTAKKNLVTIKQKNSDKAFEFTPTRSTGFVGRVGVAHE